MERKELKFSAKTIRDFALGMVGIFLLSALVVAVIVGGEYGIEGIIEAFMDEDVLVRGVIFLGVTLVFLLVYIYQRKNNVLEFGNYGFQVKGNTYAYTQVTNLVAINRGRYGTFYHLYVGDEVVFKFSHYYENKDEFVAHLQSNNVTIIL